MDQFATVFEANLSMLRVQGDNLRHWKAARRFSNSRLGASLRHLRAVDWQPTTLAARKICDVIDLMMTLSLLVGSRLWKPEDGKQISTVREKALECALLWCLKSLEMTKHGLSAKHSQTNGVPVKPKSIKVHCLLDLTYGIPQMVSGCLRRLASISNCFRC